MLFSVVSQGTTYKWYALIDLLVICRIDLWGICRIDLWKLSLPHLLLRILFACSISLPKNSSRCQTRPFQRQGYGTHIQIQPSGAINMERRSTQGELFLREYTHAWLFIKSLHYDTYISYRDIETNIQREKQRNTYAWPPYSSPHI